MLSPNLAIALGMVAGTSPGAGEVLGKVVIPRPLLIPPDLAGSAIHVDTVPDDDFVIVMTRTQRWWPRSPCTKTPAPAWPPRPMRRSPSLQAMSSGFLAPATPDASIAGISLTIAARRIA